VKEVRL